MGVTLQNQSVFSALFVFIFINRDFLISSALTGSDMCALCHVFIHTVGLLNTNLSWGTDLILEVIPLFFSHFIAWKAPFSASSKLPDAGAAACWSDSSAAGSGV